MTSLRIAVDLYDRHLPLFLGQIPPPIGTEIEFLEVGMAPLRRHGINRHKRMLVDGEFDAAEVSLASFIVALSQGREDIVGLPVFPRRFFSHNHIIVGSNSGIEQPADLVGKRVIVWAFQVTMSVLAKGDLQRQYGVPWQDVCWLTQHPEEIPADYGPDVRIELIGAERDPATWLRDGRADAYINPHPPERMMSAGSGIRRLVPDASGAARDYVRQFGYFPIMHMLAIRRELLDRRPELGLEIMHMFDTAKQQAREYYVDPGFSLLAQGRNLMEKQEEELGADLWPSGLEANHANIEDFIGFCVDQELIDVALSAEDLFHPSVLPLVTA
jgi:4,5-dihydroxyphthalate decarboxylase